MPVHEEMKCLPGYHTASLGRGQDPSGKPEAFCSKGHRQKDRTVRRRPDSWAGKTDANGVHPHAALRLRLYSRSGFRSF